MSLFRAGFPAAAAFLITAAAALLSGAMPARANGQETHPQSAPEEAGPRDRAAPAAPSKLPAELGRRVDGIQKRYENLVDFRARFVQESRLQAASGARTAKGEVFFQKPGRMRWRYESPDPQDILIRDGKFWQYVPADNQVVIQRMDTSRVEYAFLTGLGELTSQFDIRWARPRRRPGSPLDYLALTPKDKEATFAEVLIGVDDKQRILVTEVTDFLGNVTVLRFEGLEDNVGVGKERFQWENPAGADVIDMSAGFQAP